MPEWLRARSCPPNNHLPPVEISSLLHINKRGKIRPIAQIDEVLVDEFGVPAPDAIAQAVLSTIKIPYEWPPFTNVHHTVWPRRDYNDDVEIAYRNDPALMMHWQVQIHNLSHAIVPMPKKPARDVMVQRVIERNYGDIMFECGRRAVRYARWSENIDAMVDKDADVAWRENTRGYYGRMSRYEADNFNRLKENMPDSQVGRLPLREELEEGGIVSATRRLGVFSAAQARDYRRTTHIESTTKMAA